MPCGCSYVERYLDRISNGTIPDDRRSAMTELQSLVAESRSAQMSFGAMGISFLLSGWCLPSSHSGKVDACLHFLLIRKTGFPILLNVLKEDREDVELVRGALETFVSALTPIETSQGPKTEVQPASLNSDLLSRETENISLLLSLLVSAHLMLSKHATGITCFMCPGSWLLLLFGLKPEEDFYVRYYTIQLLTALLTNSLKRCPVSLVCPVEMQKLH